MTVELSIYGSYDYSAFFDAMAAAGIEYYIAVSHNLLRTAFVSHIQISNDDYALMKLCLCDHPSFDLTSTPIVKLKFTKNRFHHGKFDHLISAYHMRKDAILFDWFVHNDEVWKDRISYKSRTNLGTVVGIKNTEDAAKLVARLRTMSFITKVDDITK